DAIERAWVLVKQREAAEVMAVVRRRHEAMRAAMLELEAVGGRLFEAAVAPEPGPPEGSVLVFPKRLKVPTETPP
ncbi:hypothetical protein BDK51DRAFT_15032, partial [Blyttiomyces helicus]